MANPKSFDGTWWSVDVPKNWRVRPDKECATFQRTPSLGAFQISSARKEQSPITDADLAEFANDRIPSGTKLVRVVYGPFSGFTACFEKDDLMWREWWLRAEGLMVYATYNVSMLRVREAVKEQADVERILTTLKPTPLTGP